MLKQAEIPGPYVLVGASFVGYNMRLFAHEYPDQVAGLVLVDAGHELAGIFMPESWKRAAEDFMRSIKLASFLAPFGVARWGISEVKELPAEPRAVKLALSLRTPNVLTACDEWLNLITSESQMKGWTLPPNIPLAALSASKFDDFKIPTEDQLAAKNIYIKLLADLARQSFNSFHYVVPNSGHAIQFDRPDVVIDSVRRVVESVRTQTKLTSPNQWNKGRLDKGTLVEK